MSVLTPAKTSVTDTFRFGTAAITRGSHSGKLTDYCSAAAQNLNTLWGLTGLGHGRVNNPRDTHPWEPPSAAEGGAGLIQAAHHWSSMAAADCPQIAGIIIDDFIGNYHANDSFSKLSMSDVRDVKAALQGKPVDRVTGRVDHTAPALMPHLQLLIVVYTFELNSTLCRRRGINGTTTCLCDNMEGLFGEAGVSGVSFWPGGEDPAFPLMWSQDENSEQRWCASCGR